jgi:YfiH family protein
VSATDLDAIETTVGPERALRAAADGAGVLFGLGPPRPGADPAVRAAAVLEHLGPEVHGVRWCHQVHGVELVVIGPGTPPGAACVGTADGMITTEPGIALMVWTADCVPLLITGIAAVAAIHVGWRGAAGGIATVAVTQLLTDCGERTADLTAYLGPSVSGARYQVGPDVVDALQKQGVNRDIWLDGDRVDLRRFVAAQLTALGVGRVRTLGGCTVTSPDLASYRRDGPNAGRQWSLVFRVP